MRLIRSVPPFERLGQGLSMSIHELNARVNPVIDQHMALLGAWNNSRVIGLNVTYRIGNTLRHFRAEVILRRISNVTSNVGCKAVYEQN